MYGIVTFQAPQGARAGLLVADRVVDIAAAFGRPDFAATEGILAAWDEALPLLDALAQAPIGGVALADTRILAPVPAPRAIYCVGANYRDHVDNMMRATGRKPEPDPHEIDMPPWFFLKSAHCIVPPGARVTLACEKLDWEAELVVVIGRKARHVSAADALGCIAGYTIANDLSARDRVTRRNGDPSSPFFFDFVAQKSFEDSLPLGPALIPARFVADPHALSIQLWVNERLRINSSTSRMIYSIGEQLAQISTFITLHPGDLVLTGTPAGVGAETDEYLTAGDTVRIRIGDLGELTTTIV